MKKACLISLAVAMVAPLSAVDLFPECRKALPAEVEPLDWFPKATVSQRARIRENCRQYMTDTQTMIARLLANPDDAEAFCALVAPESHVGTLVKRMLDSAPLEKRPGLEPLVQFRRIYRFPGLSADYLHQLKQTPRISLVVKLRDLLKAHTPKEQFIRELHSILEQDAELNHAELDIICRGLQAWCDVEGGYRAAGAAARLYMKEFRGGKRVCLTSEMEHDMAVRYPHLQPFISAERTLNDNVPKFLTGKMEWESGTLNQLLWREPAKALQLARSMRRTGFELLEHKPDALRRYVRYRGIMHYREMGQEVPDCCLWALEPYSPEGESALRNQLQNLEPELRALAPRCLLATGQLLKSVWTPVKVSARGGIAPTWPDATAVQLPMWNDTLLELKKGESVSDAFQKELEAFDKLTSEVRKHRGSGVILAAALGECEQVRPNRRDLVTPVYHRIALHFAEDGVTLSYLPEDDEFHISCRESSDPVVNTALHLLPQRLHRLTLLLAVLEKQGDMAELEKSCSLLARVLNRCELWPLIICQRELRGFSTRALLALFADYEGEESALYDYGEAMGLRDEMRLARLGHEDELGDNLLRAACISRALPADADELAEAAAELMALAREQGQNADSSLPGAVLRHLLRNGVVEPVMQWKECPPALLRGRFAGNGLLLIRAFLEQNQQDEARRVLALMATDPETDTTPAYRLACALLCEQPAEAARLRKDALLLAMLHRHVDYTTYADYLAELANTGDADNHIMRLELMFSQGREAGLSPQLGFCYARQGRWDSALFAFEYMLSLGLTTTTPYGTVPGHADMFYYRAYADICRSKLEKCPELAKKALAAVADTPAEAQAAALAAMPQSAPAASAAAAEVPLPETRTMLAVLPSRSWKLKDGSSVDGQLLSFCRGGKAIRLQLTGGETRTVPLADINGDEGAYFQEWRQKNGFITWASKPEEMSERYVVKYTGRPVGALPDLTHAGAYYMAVMNEEGCVSWLRTWGLPEAERRRAEEFCLAQPGVAGLKLARTPQEAVQLAAEHKLPILLLCAPSAQNHRVALLQYMMLHPEAAAVWGRQYVILPAAPTEPGVRPLRYAESYRHELLRLEQAFSPPQPQIEQVLAAALKSHNRIVACVLEQGKVQGYVLQPDFTLPPEQLLQSRVPLNDEKNRRNR